MARTDPEVDDFLERADAWRPEMEKLRAIALDQGLDEALKWGKPCYLHDGENIGITQPFNDSCAFMFFKGVLLKDPEGVLEKPGENSRVARRLSFTTMEELDAREPALRSFLEQAVAAAEAGREVELDDEEPELPDELQDKLDADPTLRAAFEALTPGRRRGWALHVGGAKKSETRRARIERGTPKILEGKGYNER